MSSNVFVSPPFIKSTVLAATVSLVAVSTAFANTQSPDVVVVTSDRINTRSIQDAPVSVTVFTSQDIFDAGIRTTEDFVNLTPNFIVDDTFSALVSQKTIRGLSDLNNGSAPFAIIVDGVPQNDQREFLLELVDIEQIEVATGPQGGLYGRNAVAGAIIITTKKPGRDDWEGAALASIGRGVQARLQASAGGPVVSDRLFLQTSASFLTDNGRRENITLGENVDSVDHDATFRGRLIFEATPTLTLDGRLQYRDFQRGGIKYSVIESGDANDIQQPTSNLLGLSEGDVLNAVLKADLDLSPFTISLISGYTSLNETNEGDLDFSDPVRVPLGAFGTGHSAQFFGYEAKINSHEARLTYVNGDRLIAHVGASILDTDIEFPACLVVDDGSPIEVLEASCTPPNIVFFQDVENNYFAYGVYGQLNYNISDRLSVELAVRYDEDDREQRNCAFDDPSNCDLLSDTFEGLQPKIGIKYDFGDILTYLNCGRAYRSGGFNSPNVPRYRSEQTDTCEVGFKSAWLDNRLIVNGVAFYSDVEDFQFFFLEGFAQRIANIEGAEIWGVEAEIRAQPTDWLNLYAALGTTNTKANESSLFPEFEGNALPRALDYTLNLGGQVRKPINNSTSVFARIDFERRGERTWQIDNLDIQEPVSLLNARIGVEYTDYGVYLFGKNLTDEEFYVDFFPQDFSGRLNAFGDLNQPRIYGVELTATF